MKTLESYSTQFFTTILSILFSCNFSIGNKLQATEVEDIKKDFHSMRLSQENPNIIDEIINGEFKENKDYLAILPSSKSQYENYENIDPSIIGHAYQVLGQYYMVEKKDPSKAAVSYFRSLECYPFNDELIGYLRKIGVKTFISENIEKALEKITKA